MIYPYFVRYRHWEVYFSAYYQAGRKTGACLKILTPDFKSLAKVEYEIQGGI